MRTLMMLAMLVASAALGAQTTSADSQLVDVNFRFADGLYSDAAGLRTNRPGTTFKYLAGNLVVQEEAYLLKVESLYPQGRPDLPIDLERIDFICVNGLPYIRAYVDEERAFTVYAGLRVRGKLCYFAYDRTQPDTVMIKAYNPLTGRPFRQQNVVRDKEHLTENVLELTTGKVTPFTREHLLELMQDDPALVKTIKSLTPAEAEDRLQKTLLIYDDRHPVYLPPPPAEQ